MTTTSRTFRGPFKSALIVENPHTSLDEYLRTEGIEPHRLESVLDEDALIAAIQECSANLLFKRSRVPVTRRVLESCPTLQHVQLCCIGDDSVDKDAAAALGVTVCNDPASNARSVVELAIGHLVAMARRLYETQEEMRTHTWNKNNHGRYEIAGKVLGIVGLGNIGRQVARAVEELDVQVQFFDTRPVAQEVGRELGFKMVSSLEALFRTSDMVTVHTSAKDAWGNDNAGLLDDVLGQLAADLEPTSPRLYMNLARGNLHSSESLLGAVESGAIRFAAIDVYPSEPRPGAGEWQNPYAGSTAIICTPHIGAATQEAQPRIARRVATTVQRLSRWGRLRDCVYAPSAKMGVEARPGATIVAILHAPTRGARKAIDDVLFEAGLDNLGSIHRDFDIGVAYHVSAVDGTVSDEIVAEIVRKADELTGEEGVIRSVRILTP